MAARGLDDHARRREILDRRAHRLEQRDLVVVAAAGGTRPVARSASSPSMRSREMTPRDSGSTTSPPSCRAPWKVSTKMRERSTTSSSDSRLVGWKLPTRSTCVPGLSHFPARIGVGLLVEQATMSAVATAFSSDPVTVTSMPGTRARMAVAVASACSAASSPHTDALDRPHRAMRRSHRRRQSTRAHDHQMRAVLSRQVLRCQRRGGARAQMRDHGAIEDRDRQRRSCRRRRSRLALSADPLRPVLRLDGQQLDHRAAARDPWPASTRTADRAAAARHVAWACAPVVTAGAKVFRNASIRRGVGARERICSAFRTNIYLFSRC